MAWQEGQRIPANLIIGFLGSGKTTAIGKLIDNRPTGEKWSVFINEYGMVSIDQAIVDKGSQDVAVQELGGGCACCTMAHEFEPLLTRFIRCTKPDRLIVEPSGASHPSKLVDVLRSAQFSSMIDLRNTLCLIDPQDFDDARWRNTQVFQDQVQLADVVVVNWTDKRERELIDRCRTWVESFTPQKLLIAETSFGQIDPAWLDMDGTIARPPLFPDAHPIERNAADKPRMILGELPVLTALGSGASMIQSTPSVPLPKRPLRVPNDEASHDACGWIFHVDDIFDRDQLLDLLGYVHPIVRLKGIFRCQDNWWLINRAKDTTSYARSSYRRDSRLEVILDRPTSGWVEFEQKLLDCLAQND